MTTTTQMQDRATDLGKEAGITAASWMFDGNTSDAAWERARKGYEDGDPEILDELSPRYPFSGEFAGASDEYDLAEECGLECEHEDYCEEFQLDVDELMNYYEEAFFAGHADEIDRAIAAHFAE